MRRWLDFVHIFPGNRTQKTVSSSEVLEWRYRRRSAIQPLLVEFAVFVSFAVSSKIVCSDDVFSTISNGKSILEISMCEPKLLNFQRYCWLWFISNLRKLFWNINPNSRTGLLLKKHTQCIAFFQPCVFFHGVSFGLKSPLINYLIQRFGIEPKTMTDFNERKTKMEMIVRFSNQELLSLWDRGSRTDYYSSKLRGWYFCG